MDIDVTCVFYHITLDLEVTFVVELFFTCVFDHVSLQVSLVVELFVTMLTLELLQLVSLWGVAELDVFPQGVLAIQIHTVGQKVLIQQYIKTC